MMPASRDLPLPLVILCLVLIRGYSPLPTTGVTGTDPMGPQRPRGSLTEALMLASDDYSIYEDTVTTILPNRVSPNKGTLNKCDYNSCRESQIPCAELRASTGCLCPGFTLHNVAPEAPEVKSVSWNGSEVVIHWCAPHSVVTGYIVTIGGQERQKFGMDKRSGGVGNIDNISEVCVLAVNDAGTSGTSCKMYQSNSSHNSLTLTAGLIGGALGFLLLLLLAVLLWRHKRQRKQQASISMHDTAETQ
ncbi:leucine-rich repeat neuronal protein 4 [Dicentrarchus labrax]|nr:leucine-rich repeat neuronal protein 4 [Dicentrarchus labrax]